MDYTRDAALSEDYRNLDLYIAGSDQIWHPKYHEYGDFFLSLAPPKRRFSYAASFGVSEIPGNLKDYYSKHLKSFEKISVREEDGKRIVEELTGRHDIVVVPDPTMLLAREDWDSTIIDARPIDMPKRKYLIVYALHDFTPKNQEKINKYAEKNKLEVYQIMGDMYNNKYHIPDPREFVYLIKNAECVFTDSFHCCIFSIIYHRPFIVFERADGQKMSSRLMTLTNRFQLHQAMSDGKAVFDSTLKSENFSKTDTIIQEYRKIGLEYLEGVIK
jgi:hypothetical protein